MTVSETNGLSKELREAIRKEAIGQTAKWAFAALFTLFGFSAVGWWLYLKPKLIEVVGGVPAGSVVSFDLREKCPDGWSAFDAANGRFIVGAGRGDDLTLRPFGQPGGKEKHTITIREMPPHSHDYVDWASGPGSCSFSGCNGTGGNQSKTTAKTGGTENGTAEAFEIMPPFIALRLCKKD